MSRPSSPIPLESPLLGLVGIGHRDSPLALRERFARPLDESLEALAGLRAFGGPDEAVVVSTCNRTELYYARHGRAEDDARAWLLRLAGLAPDDPLRTALYEWRGNDAVRHLIRVASGLDSMLVGEGEILGQLREAYAEATRRGLVGRELHRLFQHAFLAAKKIRHDTGLGSHAASLAALAARLPGRIFPSYAELGAIVIGTGETGLLVARYLRDGGIGRLFLVSRHFERAQDLAPTLGAHALPLGDLGPHLALADILVSATDIGRILVSRADLLETRRRRKRRPMLLVDLSVPRTIDPQAAELADLFLYSLDQLAAIASENNARRQAAATEAEQAVHEAVTEFVLQTNRLLATPIIHRLRTEADLIRLRTLEQAERRLAAGHDPRDVLHFLADTLTARLLHTPTMRLREAGERHDQDLLENARSLFTPSPRKGDEGR